MSLTKYKQKRDLTKTPEPAGGKSKGKAPLFVVQKHDASHLHYDFRLEMEGVLKSWAVPKGPSMNPADKRLAIMVEDHPFDYHDFEGTIPEGNYGAGTVMVWDEGVYQSEDAKGGLKKGDLKFVLLGEKLKGEFALIKLKKQSEKDNQWLLIKKKDAYSTASDVLEEDRSVITGRSLLDIEENRAAKKVKKKSKVNVEASLGKKKVKMPHEIKPMLAHLVDEPFDDPEWLFETKWDGYRAIAEVNDQKIELYSRTFQSFNAAFEPIVEALKSLHIHAVFDGEVVVTDKNGNASFQSLQNFQGKQDGDLHYCVFDILYLEGEDLRNLPLIERKNKLESVLKKSKFSSLQYSDHILAHGIKVFEAVKKRNLEGMMAKKIDSLYHSSRSRDWLKIKTHARQEAIICGFTAPRGSREKFGALILGAYIDGELKYIGHVGGGFDHRGLVGMHKKLDPLITDKCPFKTVPKVNNPVTWVKPKLIGEVSFAEWTSENHMRQPIFMGLRPDKKPKDVKKESSTEAEVAATKKAVRKKTEKEAPYTHLDKVYWPKEGITKGDLIDYYRSMAPYILPYLKNRPESLHRYPNGIEEQGFYQKNASDSFPDWVTTFPIEHESKVVNYLLIQDVKSLLFAVNLGCIDFNPFNSTIKNVEKPDYMIIDLDPESISFEKVIDTALEVHEVLESLGVPNYCKTSGATGLHIYVPLGGKYTHDQSKEFAHLVGQLVNEKVPKFTSLERKPKNRQKAVYLDYLQNNFGQTLAAPYSVRPKPFATVSTPLEWSEVKSGLHPTDFTIKNVLKRVEKKGDLFLPVLGKGINLAAILKSCK